MSRKAQTTLEKLVTFFLEAGRTSPKNFCLAGEVRPLEMNENKTPLEATPVKPFFTTETRLHTNKDAARLLGMTPPTLRRMIAEGGIKAVVAGSTFRISDAEIQRVVAPLEARTK